ncbi:hypothetical protein ASG59_10610 [Methylobacterium sp. Leaf466]|nr:hypothetical protein ASG59_10610 [Methylobacterium sp. Leaf466]
MSEHRRELRQRTFLKGRIIFNNGSSSMDCLVRDLSASGARLAISQTAILPESFDLYIPVKEKTYRSSLRWRRSDGIGITFMDEGAAKSAEARSAEARSAEARSAEARSAEAKAAEAKAGAEATSTAGEAHAREPSAPAAPEPAASAQDAAAMFALGRRVKELEAENAALRQTLSSLLKSTAA